MPSFRPAEMLRRIPRAAWVCALVACLNAVCWSIVTPPFEVPDEPAHFAYVKQLAETGRLPSSSAEINAPEEIFALVDLRYYKVRQQPENRTISSQAEQSKLEHDLALASQTSEKGSPAAGVATSQPPLYYALEAIPYSLAGTVLGRLQLMRLLSALMAGLTAMFVFLFVREALPGAPWAWTVGGLAVALAPLLGFISGAVNPDAMLFAISAAAFYFLARAFRRGLSTRGAVTIGALMAIGFLTKLNFLGLAPGMLLGLVVLSVRAARTSGRSAYRSLALACAIAASPAGVYAIINVLSNHPVLGLVSGVLESTHRSVLHEISYVWQFYLPRLPGMTNDFPGLFTTRQLWFNGYLGLYGWLDTTFPGWVYDMALIPAAGIAALCIRGLLTSRGALRRRLTELVVYALMAIGVMTLVGAASYNGFPARDAEFAEARYLLPMLPLLGAMLALAARGAGRRWGPTAGTLIVVLFLAHDIFSQLLVVSRFYG
jgi:4-amino-4-deoxy-L-arabinose transferase-like glycosyltransferase